MKPGAGSRKSGVMNVSSAPQTRVFLLVLFNKSCIKLVEIK